MPIYSYFCKNCGHREYDFQHKYIGSRDIACPKCSDMDKHPHVLTDHFMVRDYNDERPYMEEGWEPGYNIGIDYNYKNKTDLYREIKRRGLRGKRMDGSIHGSRVKPGFYGDEEFRDMYTPTQPEDKPVPEEVME